ncbi:MAG: hypothetical protein O2964_05250 [Verrucomicrobia bacterium]|nr:hypothetical protein [Verrucomicrobiota bacterium]
MTIKPVEGFEEKLKSFRKRYPREVSVLFHNLKRYVKAIEGLSDIKSFRAGYLHPEGNGIVAIGQSSADKRLGPLAETRLYIHIRIRNNTVLLLTIGDKRSQQKGIQTSKKHITELKRK